MERSPQGSGLELVEDLAVVDDAVFVGGSFSIALTIGDVDTTAKGRDGFLLKLAEGDNFTTDVAWSIQFGDMDSTASLQELFGGVPNTLTAEHARASLRSTAASRCSVETPRQLEMRSPSWGKGPNGSRHLLAHVLQATVPLKNPTQRASPRSAARLLKFDCEAGPFAGRDTRIKNNDIA